MITKVTGKNQITIPAQIARMLEIQPGHGLDWSVAGDNLLSVRILPPRGMVARSLAGVGREWLDGDSDPIQELVDERVREDQTEEQS